jgi:hypothetical protein
MMRSVAWVLPAVFGMVVAAGARAADAPANTGLQPGKDEVGPFVPYNVTGKNVHPDKFFRGNFHSLVSENGLDPVVMVFVRGADPNAAALNLAQKLDALVETNQRQRLAACMVFLSDTIKDMVKDDDKREAEAGNLFDKFKGLSHLAVALDVPSDVHDSYKLNDKAEVTALFYYKYRVEMIRSYAPKTLDEAAVNTLIEDIQRKLQTLPGARAIRKKKK